MKNHNWAAAVLRETALIFWRKWKFLTRNWAAVVRKRIPVLSVSGNFKKIIERGGGSGKILGGEVSGLVLVAVK